MISTDINELDQMINEEIDLALKYEIHTPIKIFETICVPNRPYTLLSLHFISKLNIYDIHKIIDNLFLMANYQCSIRFEPEQALYYVTFHDYNILQINIYYEKDISSKDRHYIIEFQKNNVDIFVVSKIFRAVKAAVQEKELIQLATKWI
jgi:hypothetical protein